MRSSSLKTSLPLRGAALLGTVLITLAVSPTAGANPLDQLASRTGDDPAALVRLGDLQVEAMRLNEAKQSYRKALKADKKFGEAQAGLARIDMAKGRFEPAKKGCRAVARKYKDTAVGEICSGWFWLSNDRSTRAVEEFEKAVQKGNVAGGKTGIGEVARRRADFDDAIEAYREAIAAGAGYKAHLGLGLTLAAKGDSKGAVREFEAAVEAEPASCLSHFHLGQALGSGIKAKEELGIALQIRPGWTDALIVLGNVLLAAGETEKAEQTFVKAIEDKNGRGNAFFGLARALHTQGKHKEALEALSKTIEAIPNHVDAHLLFADIQYKSGDTDAARDALEAAMKAAPGDYKVYLHTGEIYIKLGRPTRARGYLNQAIAQKKDLSRAHELLGDISCERLLYDAGQSQYKSALEGDLIGVDAAAIKKKLTSCKPKRQP